MVRFRSSSRDLLQVDQPLPREGQHALYHTAAHPATQRAAHAAAHELCLRRRAALARAPPAATHGHSAG
jgi:hypothetical protein